MVVTYEAFKNHLTEGVESSERSCEETLQKFLYPVCIDTTLYIYIKTDFDLIQIYNLCCFLFFL